MDKHIILYRLVVSGQRFKFVRSRYSAFRHTTIYNCTAVRDGLWRLIFDFFRLQPSFIPPPKKNPFEKVIKINLT